MRIFSRGRGADFLEGADLGFSRGVREKILSTFF